MKITKVDSFIAALPYEHGGSKPLQGGVPWTTMDTLFVRLATDAGLVAWGEAFGFSACHVTAVALDRMVAPMCIGRDPSDIAALMADLRRRIQNTSLNGPVAFALSGIDIALWDLKGKVEGKPLYKMLGGNEVQSVPAYASLLRYGTAELVERNAAQAVARGYREVKLHEITVETVAAARRVCGDDTPITVDTNCAWDLAGAVAAARSFAPFRITWLEEPIGPPNDFATLARLKAERIVPIAAGENLGNFVEAVAMMEAGAVDIIQPSITRMGGITEMVKVIAAARRSGVRVAPHSPYFGPGLVATAHVIAALCPEAKCERLYCDLGEKPMGAAADAVDGRMIVPQGPGLGIEVDEGVLARTRPA